MVYQTNETVAKRPGRPRAVVPQVAGVPMTQDDLAIVEKRIEGKRSPLHEDDFKDIENKMVTKDIMTTSDGRKISRVGNFQAPQIMGHESTLKKFARIEPDYTGWIEMDADDVRIYQGLGVLKGHDWDKKLGLINNKKMNQVIRDSKEGLLTDAEMNLLEELEDKK